MAHAITFDGRTFSFLTDITLTNVGRSVATDVKVNQIVMEGSNTVETIKHLMDVKSVCSPFVGGAAGGIVIFPGESPVEQGGWNQIGADEATIKRFADKPGREFISPIIVGCIAYTFPHSAVNHHTWFSYHVYRKPTSSDAGILLHSYNKKIAVAFVEVGKDVPAEDVILLRVSGYGNGAD